MADVTASPSVAATPASTDPASLTARECEVLGAYAVAHNTGVVAAQLGITVHTVKFHLKNARHRLGARDTWTAVDAARARGLLWQDRR
jgi:DNA-binding NarL/FixJ family response regulator